MYSVIAISDTVQWGVGIALLVLIPIINLAFKAKIMTSVDEKIKPLSDKQTKMEIDLAVTTTTLNGLVDMLRAHQKENKAQNDELKELIKENDKNSKDNFKLVFDKLDKKADKK